LLQPQFISPRQPAGCDKNFIGKERLSTAQGDVGHATMLPVNPLNRGVCYHGYASLLKSRPEQLARE
jgi:hypothetical protein